MKITLEFDDVKSAKAFVVWWLDGGGEQDANFNTINWSKDFCYLRIKGNGKE